MVCNVIRTHQCISRWKMHSLWLCVHTHKKTDNRNFNKSNLHIKTIIKKKTYLCADIINCPFSNSWVSNMLASKLLSSFSRMCYLVNDSRETVKSAITGYLRQSRISVKQYGEYYFKILFWTKSRLNYQSLIKCSTCTRDFISCFYYGNLLPV